MNRKKSLFLTLLLTALLILNSVTFAYVDTAKTYFEENFDTYIAGTNLTDSSGAYNTPGWKLSNTVTHFKAVERAIGDMAVELKTVPGETGDLTKKLVLNSGGVFVGNLEIRFDYKVDSTQVGAKGAQVNVKTWTGQGICLTLFPDKIEYHNGTADGQQAITGMTKDVWNTVVLNIDTVNSPRAFDISVKNSNNITYSATGLTTRGDMTAGAGLFTVASKTGGSGNAVVTFDNIKAGYYTAEGEEDPGTGGGGEEPEAPSPIALSQGFESDTIGNLPSSWTKNSALTSDDIGYVKAAEGNGGVCSEIYLYKGASTSAVNYNIPPDTANLLYGDVYISFDFMVDPENVYGMLFTFFDSNNNHGVSFTYDGAGSLIADQREIDTTQTVKTIAQNIQKGKWYNLTFDVNMTDKTYDAYIDGVLSMDNIGFRSASCSNIRKLTLLAYDLYGDGIRKVSLDNITIKNRKDGFLVGKPNLYSYGEEVTNVGEGDTISAKVDVKNYSSQEQELSVILAQYDTDGNLIGIGMGGTTIQTSQEPITVSTSDYVVKVSDKMIFKEFVWGSMMKPVCFPVGLDSYQYLQNYSIYLLSDSITADYTPNYYPQVGLGMLLGDKFNNKVTIKNYAKPSRSTKSFIDEGRFELLERELKKGDVLFIQMGHNDKGTAVPIDDYKANLVRFINVSRARGAYPVLITPPSAFTNTLTSSLGDYPAAMLTVAQETSTPCIDLHAKSLQIYNRTDNLEDDIGWTKANIFLYDVDAEIAENHPNQYIRSGTGDGTHLRESGAQLMVDFIADEIERLNLPFSGDLLN